MHQLSASDRVVHGVAQSGGRKMMDLAWSIPDAIHLEIGEPDFTAPPHVVEAAVEAMHKGQMAYPPTAGLPELREALCAKLARVNGIIAEPDQIVVSNGGCQGIFGAFSSVLDVGDRIAVPNPGWPNYRSMAGVLGLGVDEYLLDADNGFLPDPETIGRLGQEGCRALVLNNPANPLGTIMPRGLIEDLLDVAARYDMWVISDECYDEIYFGDQPPVSAAALGSAANVISVFSFSKTHAMTGWRLGYVVSPTWIAEPIARVQEPLVLGINTPAQHGAIAALADSSHVAEMRAAYHDRRDRVVAEFRELGHDVNAPEGAIYLWLDIRPLEVDDTDFALTLLEHEHVAVNPGSSFGSQGKGFIRLSLAAGPETLATGVQRIAKHWDRLSAESPGNRR